MRYHALICDYDGTIAHDGRVAPGTTAALERLVASGRRLVLVTGRTRAQLERDFDRIELFDRIVAENGGVMYDPKSREERLLTEAADPRLVAELEARGVQPLGVGQAIVATWGPHDVAVLEAIRSLGLELEIVFNKGAVMVLPTGVTKASGLQAALKDLGLSAHNAIGVGDAENDHAFLGLCELSAAVANALPTLKERADIVLSGDHGDGVVELVGRILDDDLRAAESAIPRLSLVLGEGTEGPVRIGPRARVLLAGPSGSGKSTLVLAFLESLADRDYQFVLVDPEGDYETLQGAVTLGNADRSATIEEISAAMADPSRSVAVNLLGDPRADRSKRSDELLLRVQEHRAGSGRPHWLILDEAHHLLPAEWGPVPESTPRAIEGILGVTVHPDRIAPAFLEVIDELVVVGSEPAETIASFAKAARISGPPDVPGSLEADEALVWHVDRSGGPQRLDRFVPMEPRGERRRHRRKYAEGELPSDRSFWFRGPHGRLNLQAQNLELFMQIGDGVDDETWLHHQRQGDFSRWIRDALKDADLAGAVAVVEEDRTATPAEARRRIRQAIEDRYAGPT